MEVRKWIALPKSMGTALRDHINKEKGIKVTQLLHTNVLEIISETNYSFNKAASFPEEYKGLVNNNKVKWQLKLLMDTALFEQLEDVRKDARIRTFGSFVRRALAQYLLENNIPWDREGFIIVSNPEGMFDLYFDKPKPEVDYKTDIMKDLPESKRESVLDTATARDKIIGEIYKICTALDKIAVLINVSK